MSNDNTGGCCAPLRILTRLTFMDGEQASVVGLAGDTCGHLCRGQPGERGDRRTDPGKGGSKELCRRSPVEENIGSSSFKEYQNYVAARESNGLEGNPFRVYLTR